MAAAHRNIKRLTLWIVGAVIGLPLLLLLFFVVGSTFPGGDGGVVSVADRLKPKPDWVLERDRLTPDTWINLGSIPDPSIRRTWQVPGTDSEEAFSYAMNSMMDEQCRVNVFCYGEDIGEYCNARFVVRSDGEEFKVFIYSELQRSGVELNLTVGKS
jgi:hypothetical protein